MSCNAPPEFRPEPGLNSAQAQPYLRRKAAPDAEKALLTARIFFVEHLSKKPSTENPSIPIVIGIYGFIGPNDSGKTTTIDLILGMRQGLKEAIPAWLGSGDC